MLKRLVSICLCTFMLCTTIFVPAVSANTTPYEVTDVVFTDDVTGLDKMYSYPSAPDNWHLELKTREINGETITAVRYQCGDVADRGWAISDGNVIWYKAGEVNGFDRKFSKAEFTVWINATKYDGGKRTPVVKVKDSVNGAVTTLSDVTWTTEINGSEATSWYCKVKGVATIPFGAEFVGLGFNNSDTTASTQVIFDNSFYYDKAVLYTGAEAVKYYNDGSTLDDAWSYSNLQVVDDVITDANYNNGGKMIGTIEANYKPLDIVYKVPEGRKFKSFYTEISAQNVGTETVKIAYSEDGVVYTDFNGNWGNSLGNPGSGQNNAGWAHKYGQTVTASENINVKFIKIYQGGGAMTSTNKLFFRKISMITEGGTVSDNLTDSMSGAEKLNYEMSNLIPYSLYCYNNKKTEAAEIATQTDKFSDSDLLVVSDTTKDAYITYKAADEKVFTSVEINEVIRDSGKNIKVYVSTDGDAYTEITPTNTRIGYIHSSTAVGEPDACYNSHYISKADFDRTAGYKYIKLMHPAGNLSNINHYKLASASFTTATDAESTVVSQGFRETFESTDNLCGLSGIFASAAESRFRPTADAVGEGKTDPVYAMYKIADGKRFGYVKVKFTQIDKYLLDYVDVIALDENKEEIVWNKSSLWTEYTYRTGNEYTEFVLSGEVPANAKYLKLQMNYLEDNWRCVINGFEVCGPYDGKVYSVNEEGTATDLNGTVENGNLMGDVTFNNLDSGSKTVYAMAVLKDGDIVVNAAVKSHTLNQTGVVTLDTGILEDCTIGEDTTFEIYLFDVTDDGLTPILPHKLVF